MNEIELVLPWPPSVNHYKKIGGIVQTKTGKLYQKRVNTNETKMFYYQVWMRVKPKLPHEGFIFRNSATMCLSLTVDLYPPNERRYDIDNRLKVLLDSLMHSKVIADDSQIHRLFVQKMDTIEGGQVIVKVSELVRS